MKEKQNLNVFILTIVIVGITLIFGIYLMATMESNFRTANTPGSADNETLITVGDTGEYLTPYTLTDAVCSLIYVTNATDGVNIAAGNYTQTNCLLTSISSEFNNTNWNVSYSYTYSADTDASQTSGDLVTSLAGGSAWITIIVVVGFAVIVLGMLSEGLGGLAGTHKKEEFTY